MGKHDLNSIDAKLAHFHSSFQRMQAEVINNYENIVIEKAEVINNYENIVIEKAKSCHLSC